MEKLKLIIVYVLLTGNPSISISLFSIIGETEPLAENRLPKQLQPVELMVDATNHLGIKVLNLHSTQNKNNIAFSPCGLMSILVALYEGSTGKSNIEIKEALGFPSERDIVRVGVRDIHRRLRSYFYRKENLLNGLIFNKENITIKQEYENILRFYGYDLDTTPHMLSESKGNEEKEMSSESAMNVSTTTTTTEVVPAKPEVEEEVTTLVPETVAEETTEAQEETTESETTEETTDPSEETTEAAEEAETEAAPTRKRAVRGRLGRGLKSKKDKNLSLKNINYNRREKRTAVDQPYEFELGYEASASTPLPHTPPPPPQYPNVRTPSLPSNLPPLSSKFQPKNEKLIFDNLDSDTIDHIFYLNEYESVRVPFKIYDTIMKYSYDTSLQAHVLEIGLDSEHYDLIVIMPNYLHGDLTQVVKRLQGQDPMSLRRIRESMDYTWVKSIVPKFNLNGNTLLTNDFQNMGISDIFEPTKADFSLMADDKSIYVKNVEQTININIRTQTTQQLKKISSLYKEPVEILINCPFLFTVIDKELDMAIIMGRVVNPLNSRIQ